MTHQELFSLLIFSCSEMMLDTVSCNLLFSSKKL